MNENTIIAICALIVSVIATVLAVWSAIVQRRHMRLSVQPIAAIPISDYEGEIEVSLSNKGLGPMRIKSLQIRNNKGMVHKNLVNHMPSLGAEISWSTFYNSVDGAALEPGKRLILLALRGDSDSSSFRKCRDEVRKALKDLTVRVEYEDLYGTTMESVEKSLSWYGRHSKK